MHFLFFLIECKIYLNNIFKIVTTNSNQIGSQNEQIYLNGVEPEPWIEKTISVNSLAVKIMQLLKEIIFQDPGQIRKIQKLRNSRGDKEDKEK